MCFCNIIKFKENIIFKQTFNAIIRFKMKKRDMETWGNLCRRTDNRFYEITKASLALGVRDYTGTIWPNNLYYSTISSQSRLNGKQFKPEPAGGIFHSCSSLCIAKLCLENLSLEIRPPPHLPSLFSTLSVKCDCTSLMK